jgi:hypothetical protein
MFNMGIDWDNEIKFICSVDWDDIVNLHNIRKGLKKGEFTEIQIEERPCVLISKHNILCNKTLLECVWEHDDILFIKMKKTVD